MSRLRVIASLIILTCLGGLTWFLMPADPATAFGDGLAAVERDDWKTVEQCRDQLPIVGEWSSHYHLLSGYLLKSQNRLDLAFIVFSKANRHSDTRVDAYFQAGSIRYSQQRFSDSVALLKQVLAWQPDHLEAHQLIAAASYDIGAMEQAIVSLDQVIRLAENPQRAAYMKASILFDFERFADSVTAYELALQHVESASDLTDEIRSGCAAALIRLRRFQEALKLLTPAKPWPEVLVQRAQANFSLNELEIAQQQVTAALKQQPHHADGCALLAQILERQGQRIEGIAILDAALKQHPQNLPAHHRMADLLAAEGRTEAALKFRTRAAEIAKLRSHFSHAQQDLIRDESNPLLRLKVADLAEQLDRLDDANAWYRAAIGMAPANAEVVTAYNTFLKRHPVFQQQHQANQQPLGDIRSTQQLPSDF